MCRCGHPGSPAYRLVVESTFRRAQEPLRPASRPSRASRGSSIMRDMQSLLTRIPARDPEDGLVNVVIDTPRGSRNKYKFDEELGCFKLSRVLPAGHVFPYDFGSI